MIRKVFLFLTALAQYARVKFRNKSELKQNDLLSICKKQPITYARDDQELMFVLNSLRPIARKISPDNLCLDLSLVLINMSAIPSQIHFSIRKKADCYTGHAWIETQNSLFSTDYTYEQDSIWSWEKPLDVL